MNIALLLLSFTFLCFGIDVPNKWAHVPETSTPPSPRYGTGQFVYNNKLWVIGGRQGSLSYSDVWTLDLLNPIWAKVNTKFCGAPRSARFRHSVALVDNVVWLYSGNENDPNVAVGDMWTLNLDTLIWTQIISSTQVCANPGSFMPSVSRGFSYSYGGNWYFSGGQISRDLFGNRVLLNHTWAFNFATQSWSMLNTVGTPPRPTLGNSGTGFENKFWTTGGYLLSNTELQRLYEFNCDTLTWTVLNTTKDPPARGALSLAYASNHIYLMFGFSDNDVNDVWELDLGDPNLAWVQLDIGPTPRDSLVSDIPVFKNNLWVFGGWGNGNFFNDLWTFDIVQRKWNNILPTYVTPSPRYKYCSTTIANKFFIFGGTGDSGDYLEDMWMFDLVSLKWTLLTTIGSPTGRIGCSMVSVGERIFIFGGEDNTGPVNDIWAFDEKKLIWTTHVFDSNIPIPSGRSGHVSWTFGRKIFIYGGVSSNQLKNDFWEFDVDKTTWLILDPKNDTLPLLNARAMILENGDVYLVGGTTGGDTPHGVTKISTSSQIVFSSYSLPNAGSSQFNTQTASVQLGGKMISHGGTNFNTPEPDVYIYDIENLEWNLIRIPPDPNQKFPSSRWGHSMASYKNTLLIFGGYGTTSLNDMWVLHIDKLCIDIKSSQNCFVCSIGSYISQNGTCCDPCKKGTYGGSTSPCTGCPRGFYGDGIGSPSSEFCYPCPTGTYSNTEGQQNCTVCPPNKYCPFGATRPLDPPQSNDIYTINSNQPVIEVVDLQSEANFTYWLWGTTAFVSVIVICISAFIIACTNLSIPFRRKLKSIDILFDTQHRPVDVPGVFVVRRTTTGGALNIVTVVLIIMFTLSYIIPYFIFNESESRTLVPNYLIWEDKAATTQFNISISLYNFGGTCTLQTVEGEKCPDTIRMSTVGLVTGKSNIKCSFDVVSYKCSVIWTCFDCGFDPKGTSAEQGLGEIQLSLTEPEVYASIITWDFSSFSSLPERWSTITGYFVSQTSKIFRGATANLVTIRAIQSQYQDSKRGSSRTRSGFHLEYLGSQNGSEIDPSEFHYTSGVYVNFKLTKAENTLSFSKQEAKNIIDTIAQVLGTISGLVAGLSIAVRILEALGLVRDGYESALSKCIDLFSSGKLDKSRPTRQSKMFSKKKPTRRLTLSNSPIKVAE